MSQFENDTNMKKTLKLLQIIAHKCKPHSDSLFVLKKRMIYSFGKGQLRCVSHEIPITLRRKIYNELITGTADEQ